MISTAKVMQNLQKELGSFYSTEAHTSADMLRYINSAARAICISRNFWFNKYTETVVVTDLTTEYSVPYQIATFFILDAAWDEVEVLNFEDYYRRTDKSEVIMIEEDKLVSEKTWTFQIFYRWFPTTLTDITEDVALPEHFFDALVLKATYFWFMDIRSYEKANEKKAIFDWMIKDMAKRSSDPKPLVTKRLNKSKNSEW